MIERWAFIMKLKYKIMLSIIAVLVAFCSFLEYKYQVFMKAQQKFEESLVFVDENLSVNYLTGNHITGNGTIKVHFSITNTSANKIKYFISLNSVYNDKDEVTYSLNSSKLNDNVDFQKLNLGDSIIGSNLGIEPMETVSYDLFINNAINFKMDINIGYEKDYVNLLSDLIIGNSYNLLTDEDNNGEVKLFPANSNNNYVTIDDTMYRILGINGNGTIMIMMNNKIGDSKFYDTPHLLSIDYNETVLNNYLNDYYQNNLTKYDNIISDGSYCSDVSLFNTINYVNYYDNYNRISNNNPTLKCNNPLTKKIGIISADLFLKIKNNDDAGFLKKDDIYYTSNFAYLRSGNYPNMITIKEGNVDYNNTADNELAIYPVINLNSDVLVIGDGTSSNPYQIIY